MGSPSSLPQPSWFQQIDQRERGLREIPISGTAQSGSALGGRHVFPAFILRTVFACEIVNAMAQTRRAGLDATLVTGL
jgi:hypothetical protein